MSFTIVRIGDDPCVKGIIAEELIATLEKSLQIGSVLLQIRNIFGSVLLQIETNEDGHWIIEVGNPSNLSKLMVDISD